MAKANTKVEEMETQETVKKEAVNIMDLLLGADIEKIELPSKQVEITRLSAVYGAPFIVTCKALTPEKYEEVQDMSVAVKGKDVDLDVVLMQTLTVIEGVVDAEGKPMLKNKDLMAKFKAQTPKELVKKIFLSGEITSLYGEIGKLTGFSDNAITEIKN